MDTQQLEWTTTKPTQPGWYWRYHHHDDRPTVVELVQPLWMPQGDLAISQPLISSLRPVDSERPDTLWAGPLLPPSR